MLGLSIEIDWYHRHQQFLLKIEIKQWKCMAAQIFWAVVYSSQWSSQIRQIADFNNDAIPPFIFSMLLCNTKRKIRIIFDQWSKLNVKSEYQILSWLWALDLHLKWMYYMAFFWVLLKSFRNSQDIWCPVNLIKKNFLS